MQDNFKTKLIKKLEEELQIELVSSDIPPQGMDSQVFFVKDIEGKEYAVKCYNRDEAADVIALNLLKDNRIEIPVPKVFGTFNFEGKLILILERINYPLLDSVSVDHIGKYVPSMIRNLQKIHKIKSSRPGLLTDIKKEKSWKEIMLHTFNDQNPNLQWDVIASREGLDKELVLRSVQEMIQKINNTEFDEQVFSLLHTDFNQRNLFVNPNTDEITGIIDWGESMFGDPIYDFARVRMLIWHFNLGEGVLKVYNDILYLTEKEKELEKLYWLSRVVEYLAYYSEELNGFNIGRIQMHQNFLRKYFN